jgi:basic membrane protein A
LANGGVGLAPFHDLDASVPQALKDQIETLKAGISDGSVDVKK